MAMDGGELVETGEDYGESNIIFFNNPQSPLIDHIGELIGIEQVELIDDVPEFPRENHPLLTDPFFLVYSHERTIKTIILIDPIASNLSHFPNWEAFYGLLKKEYPEYKRLIVRNPSSVPLSAILRKI